MDKLKKILFPAFALVCLIQLAVPVNMIFGKEKVLNKGHAYKFRTAPVDPYDPFRGKYITLSFDAGEFKTGKDNPWKRGEEVYVLLGTDSAGYAIATELSQKAPESSGKDYVRAEISYSYEERVTIDYPFSTYYMEEGKAYDAELKYREANRRNDTIRETYALVSVLNGEAALKDVIIGNSSIRDLVDKDQSSKKEK